MCSSNLETRHLKTACEWMLDYAKRLYNYYFEKECKCNCCIKAKKK